MQVAPEKGKLRLFATPETYRAPWLMLSSLKVIF